MTQDTCSQQKARERFGLAEGQRSNLGGILMGTRSLARVPLLRGPIVTPNYVAIGEAFLADRPVDGPTHWPSGTRVLRNVEPAKERV